MEFELTKSQKGIQKAAREFAKGKFDKETINELARNRQYPDEILRQAAELGFVGLHFPEACDGGGMGLTEYVLVAEQFCKKDSALGMALLFAGFASECIVRFADDRATEKFVLPVVNGQSRSAGAFFEPRTAGDPAATQTTAEPENRQWRINGEKSYVPNGLNADFFIVLCKTRDSTPADKGLSLIIVDGKSPGISATDAGPTLGANLTSFAHLRFENVIVTENRVIPKVGAGYGQILLFLNEHRIQLAAMALGTAQGAFERAQAYVKQREQFGKKLGQFQVTRHKLADMAAGIESARWLVYRTAWLFDQKKCDAQQAAAAKMVAARTALTVTDEAVQLLGGYGYMAEYEVEHFYRDAKTIELLAGSPGVLRDAIAEQAIGKIK